MPLETILLMTTAALLITTSLVAMKSSTQKGINKYLAAFTVSVSLWCSGIAFYINADIGRSKEIFLQMYYIAPIGIALSSMAFAFEQQNEITGKKPYRQNLIVLGSIILGLLLSLAIALNPKFVVEKINSTGSVVLNMTGYSIYSIVFLSVFISSLVIVARLMADERGRANKGFYLYAKTLLLASTCGVFFNLVLPFLGNYKLIWVGPLVCLSLPLSIVYGVVNYRAFNIRTSAFRAVGYSLSIATLVLMYSLVVYGIVLPVISPKEGFRLSILLMIIGGTAGTIYFYDKIKLVFDVITEKIFFKNSYNLPKFLDELNQALINSGGVEELSANVMNTLAGTLKSDFLILAVKNENFEITIDSRTHEPGKEVFDSRITPYLTTYHFKESQRVVLRDYIDKKKYGELYEILLKKDTPIAIDLSESSTRGTSLKKALENKEQKVLFLGPKKSGESYSVQDFDALRIISKELVIALQNALRFEEIKLFNLELQKKVEVATIKLRQQNKKLVAADELKDDFLSIASHQMRTPISTILGYTSILNSGDAGKMSKEQEKFSKVVESSTKRLAYLINDFLTVSRLKSGKFAIEKVDTDLKAALKDEVVDLEHQFAAKNVKLNLHIDGQIPRMNADEQKLRQVMMNLMDNALHYTPEGGTVEVTMKMDGRQLCFEVKDNGIGVPKAEQAKLFSKMFRAGNAQKMRPDGTGLGLYLAKKVVLGHNGHIIFKSKEGEGSTFGFKIPLK